MTSLILFSFSHSTINSLCFKTTLSLTKGPGSNIRYQLVFSPFTIHACSRTSLSRTPRSLGLKPISLGFALAFQSFILGYLELGYLELPAISNLNPFPLDLPLRFQPFILVYLELPAISNLNPSAISLGFSLAFSVIPTRLSRTQLSRTIFCFPWPKSTPVISNSNDEVDQWTNRSESVRTQLESILKRHYTFNIRRTSINIKIIRNCALVFAV